MDDLAPGQQRIEQLRAAGFGQGDIDQWTEQRRLALTQGGFSADEVNGYFGVKPFNDEGLRSQTAANLEQAFNPQKAMRQTLGTLEQEGMQQEGARKAASEQEQQAAQAQLKAAGAKPTVTFEDALKAGWQLSTAGLVARGKAPSVMVDPETAPWYSRIASEAAQMAGDIPAMVGGAFAGTAAGAETGPGAAITGAAGAFALPTALRRTLMDAYEGGSFKNFQDFWSRASGIFIDTAKSYVTGAATGAAGVAAPSLLPETVSPAVRALVKTGAEVGTMTTVGKALEGKVPNAQDFLDAAILVAGLHGSSLVAGKLRSIYAETGVPPQAVLQDMQHDVTIQQDLLSERQGLPQSYQAAAEKAATEGPAQVMEAEKAAAPELQEAPEGTPPAIPPEPPPSAGAPPASPEDAENRILDHLSIGETEAKRPWTFARFYTNVVDKFFPIKQAVDEAAGGNDITASDNAYKLARLMSGVAGKADVMLTGSGTFNFNDYQNNGPSLEKVLEPVKDNLDGFRAYAASQRALELEGRDIKTGFDLDAAREVVKNGADKYEQTLQGLINYQNNVAAYLRDSGVLSPEGYDAMLEANKLYVPFQRVMEDWEQTGAPKLRGGSLQASNPVKGIVGSEREVIDPIESIIRNTYLFTQMAERNAVGTKLIDMLKEADEAQGIATEPAEAGARAAIGDFLKGHGVENPDELEPLISGSLPPAKGDEIRIFRDGKPETYTVDPELARAIKGLDQQSMGDIERMLRPFSRLLRAGAVLQPDFMARHTLRDFLYAVVTGKSGLFTPADMVRGFIGLATKDQDYDDWLKSGGGNVSMVALDRQYLQTSIDDLADTGVLERAWNVVENPQASAAEKVGAVATLPLDLARKYLLSPLQAGVQFAENASHLGAFKKEIRGAEAENAGAPLTKEQIQEAGFQSRDIAVDAARMGAKIRAWNSISAFSNITIQDTDRVIRAIAEHPASTMLKIAGAISLPSALVWWAGKDDSRYRNAPNWEKDLFWVIPLDKWENATLAQSTGLAPDLVRRSAGGQLQINNGVVLRIPKPWGMGLMFGSTVERTLDAYYRDNPKPFEGWASSFGQVSIPNFLPNAMVPVIEQFANRSIFTDRTLVPSPMEKYLPEYQYTPYTTELAKSLGKIVGAFPGIKDEKTDPGTLGGVARAVSSPILLENYLRAWTGNLGMYALQAADEGLRKAGVLPDPVYPSDTMADVPFVKAFVMRYPTMSSQAIQDFYDSYDRNKTYFDTWMGMAKEGDIQATQHIEQMGGPQMFQQMTGIHTALAENAKLVRDIYKNPTIAPDQKRQLIDSLYYQAASMAKMGNAAMAMASAGLPRPQGLAPAH